MTGGAASGGCMGFRASHDNNPIITTATTAHMLWMPISLFIVAIQ